MGGMPYNPMMMGKGGMMGGPGMMPGGMMGKGMPGQMPGQMGKGGMPGQMPGQGHPGMMQQQQMQQRRPQAPQQQQQQQMPDPNAPLSAAALAAAPPGMQKQMLGTKLYPRVAKYQPELAGKVTGMMLEMDNSELLILLESEPQMKNKIDEALRVLEMQK